MMKSWNSPSELWMERMLESISDSVVSVVASRPPVQFWRHKIPVLGINWMRRYQVSWWLRSLLNGKPLSAREFDGIRLLKLCRAENVASVLVHYANWAERFSAVWQQLDKPVFVHVHGFDIDFDATHDACPDVRICDDDYPRRLVDMSRYVVYIANSCQSRDRLLGIGVPPERIRLKYIGVPIPKSPLREKTERITFLYLARLVEWKGPHLTIQAFNEFRARGGLGRLVIAGDGPLREECEELAKASNYSEDIQMLGTVDPSQGDILRASAEVFVAHNCRGLRTGREEALGVAPIEAMAAGLPVLTGRSGGLIETVIDSVTGFLFEPGDISAQADCMLKLATDPDLLLRMSQRARAHVIDQFSIELEQKQLREILDLA